MPTLPAPTSLLPLWLELRQQLRTDKITVDEVRARFAAQPDARIIEARRDPFLAMRPSRLFDETLLAFYDPDIRIIVHQGGSRTTKTWSVCQALAYLLHHEKGLEIDCVRKTYADLHDTGERTFWKVVDSLSLYDEALHRKGDHRYLVPGMSQVHFAGLQFAGGGPNERLKGQERDVLWWNEPTDGTLEDWRQLSMRTSALIILDYNPDYSHHWIYDEVLPRDDCHLVISNYRDGEGFVAVGQLDEIKRKVPIYELPDGDIIEDWGLTWEDECRASGEPVGTLIEGDVNAWGVYGLGRHGSPEGSIYPRWTSLERWPDGVEHVYGLDWGFSNPFALVKCGLKGDDLYWQELCYEAGLLNPDIADRLADAAPDAKKGGVVVYADNAEPKSIDTLRRLGWQVEPCEKKATVWEQLKWVKSKRLHIVGRSPNLKREIKAYHRRKDRATGEFVDEPAKRQEIHAGDSGRYGSYTAWGEPVTKPTGAFFSLGPPR